MHELVAMQMDVNAAVLWFTVWLIRASFLRVSAFVDERRPGRNRGFSPES